MVAYSFQKVFAPLVSSGQKTHTIRSHRKRHARPGEAVQLYTGMRTKYCRKLVAPDPVCIRAAEIAIDVSSSLRTGIDAIAIDGIPLTDSELETLCRRDGFDPTLHFRRPKTRVTARQVMGVWWRRTHGPGRFDGVIVYWKPQP